MKITGIKDQKNFLASIKREKEAFQQLQTNSKYNKVYEFGYNATCYVQGCFCLGVANKSLDQLFIGLSGPVIVHKISTIKTMMTNPVALGRSILIKNLIVSSPLYRLQRISILEFRFEAKNGFIQSKKQLCIKQKSVLYRARNKALEFGY